MTPDDWPKQGGWLKLRDLVERALLWVLLFAATVAAITLFAQLLD